MEIAQDEDIDPLALARVGTVLRGKYRIDRVLGVGGMAIVYKATHRNQAEFAVKILHAELSRRKDLSARFLREGYAANSVKHPGAVLVVDDDVAEDGAAFLVMELIDGVCVEALWESRQHRLSVEMTVAIAHQLLDVLAAAHANKIIHRDIKPANLFITREGMIKVLDFGIARVRDAADKGNATESGMLLGTPAFMPPEQALAKASEMDGQTDVWAVGATMFTLMTGLFVHEGDNAPQVMVKAATQRSRAIVSVMPTIPLAVARVIDRALSFEKSERWPSAAAMKDALAAASNEVHGVRPSRTSLEAIFAVEPPPRAAEAGARSPYVQTVKGPLPERPMSPPMGIGTTTAQPVATASLRPPMNKTLSGRSFALVLGIPLVGAILALGVVGLRAASKTTDAGPAAAPQPLTSAPATLAAPPAAVTAASASAAIASPSSGLPLAPPSMPPSAIAPPPRNAAQAGRVRSSLPPDAGAPAAPKPNCDPPYTLDAAGHHKAKPECM